MFFYFQYANQCYLRANLQQSETIAWCNTLISQIKSVEGYNDDFQIAYINRENKDDKTAYQSTPIQGIVLNPYNFDDLYNNYTWRSYMMVWCGFCQPEISDYSVYDNHPAIEAMPSYPDDGSIKIIDNVVVVKF